MAQHFRTPFMPLLLIYMIRSCHSLTNQYIKQIGPNQEDIWRSTSDFIPVQSQSFGTITIRQIMSVEFDFIFGGRTNDPRVDLEENFFRIGHNARNSDKCDGQESHYPSLWLSNTRNYLHVSCSSGSVCSSEYSLSDYKTINTGVTYHILIAFNNTRLSIQISGGGRPDWHYNATRQPTLSQFIGVEVPIWWMSNKFQGTDYNRGNGTFSNITIISYTPPTKHPTDDPTPRPIPVFLTPTTRNPTLSPTMEPTIDTQSPTFAPSFPTVYETDFPSWNPTQDPTFSPSDQPTPEPTKRPTRDPSRAPTMEPTVSPTIDPTLEPTADPTVDPTMNPTVHPTSYPTSDPSVDPTMVPTVDPTIDPSMDPTIDPTIDPTRDPTQSPTVPPTDAPTHAPTYSPSGAPTYSPSASPTWSPTANLLEFDRISYVNMSLSCGTIYNENTTVDHEFDYYRLDLSDIARIPKMIATTCCKSEPQQSTVTIDGVEYFLVANTTSYCDNSSLDTVLYVLKYDARKQQTTILAQHDDDTRIGFCHDGVHYGKSSIDITSLAGVLEVGSDVEYYIAVGGYRENNENSGYTLKTGRYQLELFCDKYIYPLDSAQFKSNENEFNSNDIECGQSFHNQVNTEQELVSYYYFDITKKTETPIIVSTCDIAQKYGHYATYLYIASIQYYRQEASGFTIIKQETLDEANCDILGGIDISSLDIDKYIIVVGGFNSTIDDNFGNLETGNFSISVSCGYPAEPFDTVTLVTVVSVAVFIFVCCCICFWVWYCRALQRYKEEHPRKKDGIRYASAHERIISESLDLNRIKDDSVISTKKVSNLPVSKIKVSQSSPNVIGPRYRSSIGAYSPTITTMGRIAGRHLEEKDMEEHPDMDMIIAVLQDVIASCEDEEDLDVYQVLAFRRLDDESYKLKLFEPFKLLGIEWELLNLSPWHRSLFVALIVAALQGFGITIILYSVTYEYFTDPSISSACSWHVEDWRESWMFKLLALLWALVITLSLSATLKGLNHTGFNQIIERVDADQYARLDVVDVGFIYLGYLMNLYTLLLAVFGSYFLVYSSEEGTGAIDMVLNAVALFFMIELDDMLVTNQDYSDIQRGTNDFLQQYLEEKKASVGFTAIKTFKAETEEKQYTPDAEENDVVQSLQKQYKTTKQWFNTNGLLKLAQIVECLVFVIHFMALFGGLIAPGVIFICFGSNYH